MNLLAKIVIVLLFFSICGAGTFIASTKRHADAPKAPNVTPVKNFDSAKRVWILT